MRVPARKQERDKEKEKEPAGKGRNNKKEQMPAAIKTTESIKNFRPFTAELPLDEAWSDNMREKSNDDHDAPRRFAVLILAQLQRLKRFNIDRARE